MEELLQLHETLDKLKIHIRCQPLNDCNNIHLLAYCLASRE